MRKRALAGAAITASAASLLLATAASAGTPVQARDAFWGARPKGLGIAGNPQNITGGKGEFVRVAEYNGVAKPDHPEIFGSHISVLPGVTTTPADVSGHETSMASVVAGNTLGIVPNVKNYWEIVRVDPVRQAVSQTDADAVNKLGPGDVLLLEVAEAAQITNPSTGVKREYTVPTEFADHTDTGNPNDTIYNEIRAATDRGVIVIEPTGNGNTSGPDEGPNLAWPDFGGKFTTRPDSGAIMVGAGSPPSVPNVGVSGNCGDDTTARSRIGWAPYGARVDVQAPGYCYPAANYDPAIPSAPLYAATGGTSGASAITAGVVASLSSIYQGVFANGSTPGPPPTPDAVRNSLRRTGPAQTGANAATERIGNQVDLEAAMLDLVLAPKTTLTGGPTVSTTNRPTFTFSTNVTGSNIRYQCRIIPAGKTFDQLVGNPLPSFAPCGTNGAATSSYQPATGLANGDWQFEVRSALADSNGLSLDASPEKRAFSVISGRETAAVASGSLKVTATATATTLSAKQVGSTVQVDDAAGIVAGAGCTQSGFSRAVCATSGFTSVQLNGGSGNDNLSATTTSVVAALFGLDGNDRLTYTGSLASALSGGNGNDTIVGGNGGDVLTGGPGTDSFSGNGGNDQIDSRDSVAGESVVCGAGTDSYKSDAGDVIASDCETATP